MKGFAKAAAVGLLLPWAASAQAAEQNSPECQFAGTFYAWLSDFEGNLNSTSATQPVAVDLSSGDVLKHLKFGAFGSFQAKKDRLILIGDFTYAHLGAEKGIAIRDVDLVDAELDASTFTSTILGGYRVADGPVDVDLMIGGRIVVADTDLKLTGPQRTVEGDVTETWIDPIVATHVGIPVTRKTTLALYGDIGGGSSDLTWQALAGIQHQISSQWLLSAGWRYYSVDYDKGAYLYDVTQSGPILGARFEF
jgi:opacity protein-like surface antigen